MVESDEKLLAEFRANPKSRDELGGAGRLPHRDGASAR